MPLPALRLSLPALPLSLPAVVGVGLRDGGLMRLLTRDEAHRYELHRSDLIRERQREFIAGIHKGIEAFRRIFGNESPTWSFKSYNAFALTAGSVIFHQLYRELTTVIRGYCNHGGPLWFQSWVNFHLQHEVLDWHRHRNSAVHGYISIQPHKTKTLFETYEIINEVGNLYIAPSGQKHKVEVLEDFRTPRITIAFDVFDERNIAQIHGENKHVNLSVMPL